MEIQNSRQGKLANKLFNTAKNDLKQVAEAADPFVKDTLAWSKDHLKMPPIKTEITRDPKDANAPGDAKLTASHLKQEAKILAQLSKADQGRYQGVAKLIDQDPPARLALFQLLSKGALERKDSQGQSLLNNLAALSQQPLIEGLERKPLLADLAEELADPASINQKSFNTCGVTSAQIILAQNDPSEYVRLAAGLASPEGKVTTRGGEILSRKEDWKAGSGERTRSSDLVQPAFMEYANGNLTYDNAKDISRFHGLPAMPGIMPGGMASLLETLYDKPYETAYTALGINDETRQLLKSAAPGHEIPVVMNYQNKPPVAPLHWMLLTGIKDGYASFINPYGYEERMTVAEFEKQVMVVAHEG